MLLGLSFLSWLRPCPGSSGTPAVDNLEQNLNVGGDIEEASARQETPVFEKYNALLHGGITTTTGKGANKRKEVLSVGFVKKYIQYAKNRIQPVLTQGAAEHITATYTALRNDDLQLNQKRVSAMSGVACRKLAYTKPLRPHL